MTELKTITRSSWTNAQALALALFSLLLGLCGGLTVRRIFARTTVRTVTSASASTPHLPSNQAAASNVGSIQDIPSPAELKQAADEQAAPLVEQLRADPNNADLATKIGNLYYDAKQYPIAIDYYEHVLKSRPKDTEVRTDLGTAYWYAGDANKAIKEFQQALLDEPNKANALFNLGIVEWKGKHDAPAAIGDWQKLLATNPGFAARAQVEQLIAEAQGSAQQRP